MADADIEKLKAAYDVCPSSEAEAPQVVPFEEFQGSLRCPEIAAIVPSVLLSGCSGASSQGLSLIPLPRGETSQDEAEPYIPSKESMPGELGFRITFNTAAPNHGKSWAYSNNTLHVKKNSEFVITFTFEHRPPPGCELVALVCYKDNKTFLESPPIAPLSKEPADTESHFLTCKHSSTRYLVLKSIPCLALPLDSLPVDKDGPYAVFSCTCYSGGVLTSGGKTDMVLIFSLFRRASEQYEELARDVVDFKSVSTPSRLLDKPGASALEPAPRAKRRRRSSEHQLVAPCECVEQQPDKDGFYHFRWDVKVKDPREFQTLLLLREGLNRRYQ